jgi:hypothetical protein
VEATVGFVGLAEDFFLGGTSNLSARRAGLNSVSQSSSAASGCIKKHGLPSPGGVIAGELAAAHLFPAILGGEVSIILISSKLTLFPSDAIMALFSVLVGEATST